MDFLIENAVHLHSIDCEDSILNTSLVFKINEKTSIENAYNEVQILLHSPVITGLVVKQNHLDCDLFEYDTSFVFSHTTLRPFDFQILFYFVNHNGVEVAFNMNFNFTIYVGK